MNVSALYHSSAARAVLSGLLLGAAFPPSPVTSLAFVAFIPFLSVFVREDSGTRFLGYLLMFLVSFHVVTVYWTGGFVHGNDPWMMAAGAALLLLHPWFMAPFVMGAWWVRRRAGKGYGLASFASFWMVFEYFHERGEWSFPWMVIGNSQAYDIARIQIADLFSVQGLGLHILAFNVLAYLMLERSAGLDWRTAVRNGRWLLGGMIAVYAIPLAYGVVRLNEWKEHEGAGTPVELGIVQPDIDPWEKWGSPTRAFSWAEQLDVLDSLTASVQGRLDLVLWPETAVPVHVLLPQNADILERIKATAARSQAAILTGLPHARYFTAADAPVTARKLRSGDAWVESYNAATLIATDGSLGPVYAKVVLVPFAERIPYAEELAFLVEPLRWGVGISSWGKGNDTTVFSVTTHAADTVLFGAMICYESVYPQYVRTFVRKGAQFLVIVTNDSWWGRTSGAYQHAAFASIRAVENRRWVVQCANGGLSVVVRPDGRVLHATGLYTRAAFHATIRTSDTHSPFVSYGDMLGPVNVAGGVVLLLVAFRKGRKG